MAHEIALSINGLPMAVFGENDIPWWNKADMPARVLAGFVSFDDIFNLPDSPFAFQAIMEQLQYADGRLSSQHGIRRSDTGSELGVHSGNYGNIQPKDLFDFCAAFFAAYPEIPIASAIAMQDGAVLNLSARLGEINILNSGDIHKSYLCFVNSYNGRIKAQVYKSYIRPVCMNTTVAGVNHADFNMVYKHTKNVRNRIAADSNKAAQLMAAQQATDTRVKDILETLAKRQLSGDTGKLATQDILNNIFGEGDTSQAKKVHASVAALFADNDNNTFPDFAKTPYALYNAVTNFIDHTKQVQDREGKGKDLVRFESGLIGKGAVLKTRALEYIYARTENCEESQAKHYDMLPSPTDQRLGYGSVPAQPIISIPSTMWVDVTPAGYGPVDDNEDDDIDVQSKEDSTLLDIAVSHNALLQNSSEEYSDLYTTCPLEKYPQGYPGVTLWETIKEISDTVRMNKYHVPANKIGEYMQSIKSAGYAAFDSEQWSTLEN